MWLPPPAPDEIAIGTFEKLSRRRQIGGVGVDGQIVGPGGGGGGSRPDDSSGRQENLIQVVSGLDRAPVPG